MPKRIPSHHYALIKALKESAETPTIEQLASASETDQALISAAAVELEREGIVAITEQHYTELKLGELGSTIQVGSEELPERLIARAVRNRGNSASIKDLSTDSELKEHNIQPGKFAKSLAELGWAEFKKGTLELTKEALDEPPACDIEAALTAIHVSGGVLTTDDHTDPRILSGARRVKSRKELLTSRERSRRFVALTEQGQAMAQQLVAGEIVELQEVNELTPDLLCDGAWRDVQFRPYDVTLTAEQVRPGKAHPLARIIEKTRQAFLEMGFSEASCPMAELAFWDFDALFQPQDHPAREMQDTFYCATPSRYPLPGRTDWVAAVKGTHEDGWETGSRGWRYQWSEERAAQVVLRTHMTASSIRAIARNPEPPQKVFSIGRVFRRETVDYKHLPEFYQVDGIIIDEYATFSSLLGTLTKFYERLGIPEVRFKPDFFPYTEPSVSVEMRFGGRWHELAGAGIFRPEVTRPFGCQVPVLAWGLGLERLAMVRYGIDSMKNLYQADLDWLKGVPINS